MTEGEVAALILASFCVWVVAKSPILRWIAALMIYVSFGLLISLSALFVAIFIDIPAHKYGAAAGATVIAAIFLILFFATGYKPMIEHCKDIRRSMRLWDK